MVTPTTLDAPEILGDDPQRFQSHFHLQLNQVQAPQPFQQQENRPNLQRPFSDGDFEFVRNSIIFNQIIYAFCVVVEIFKLRGVTATYGIIGFRNGERNRRTEKALSDQTTTDFRCHGHQT